MSYFADRCVVCNKILEKNSDGLVTHKCSPRNAPSEYEREPTYGEKLDDADFIKRAIIPNDQTN